MAMAITANGKRLAKILACKVWRSWLTAEKSTESADWKHETRKATSRTCTRSQTFLNSIQPIKHGRKCQACRKDVLRWMRPLLVTKFTWLAVGSWLAQRTILNGPKTYWFSTSPNQISDWQKIPAPFRTRALAVRAHGGKLVVVGGIEKEGGPTAAVHILDPATNQWTEGPEVPTEGSIKAFGCSAVSLNGNLLVSTYDGNIFRLSDDGSQWEVAQTLESGRFFHQMIPVSDSRFAIVGGSHMENGSQNEVEVFEVPGK